MWDLVRCAIVWSYNVEVHRLAVDMSVNYKANLVFPSPASLVSSFVVTNGQHIFLFNPSSPKVYEASPPHRTARPRSLTHSFPS